MRSNNKMTIKYYDKLTQRCRRLGSDVTFNYCRCHAEENGSCSSIIQCWWERFDVAGHLNAHLTKDQFLTLEQPQPKPKITKLMEIIQEAQRRVSK